MNPLVQNVRAAFDRVATHAESIHIDRAGIALPAGGHLQGIQRFDGGRQRLVMTSSSDAQAYFVVCDMAADGRSGRAHAPVFMPKPPLTHAGGCQAVGQYLVAGVEVAADKASASQIQFWDLGKSPPVQTGTPIFRFGQPNVATAGAVGMTSFANGYALAVATFNAGTVDFYVSAGNPFAGSPFALKSTWTSAEADKTGWIDPNFGNYQNINLLTQADGQLFMMAFDRSGLTDWMDLFSVNLNGPANAIFWKLAKKVMTCTDGCAFDAGSGIYVANETGFDVYAVSGSSGDHDTGTTIRVNHFAAT